MNSIDAEREKRDETPAEAALRHEARGYRKGYLTAPVYVGMDLATGPDQTVYACREHINTPHPACPTCAEVARLSSPQPGDAK